MKFLYRQIPNIFTALNLLFGCVAIVLIFRNRLEMAAYCVVISAFFDMMDGLSARVLKLGSSFGRELDSLADVISFGFVPGAILFKMLQHSQLEYWVEQAFLRQAIQFLPFFVTVFSALRLAKFNLDKRQTDSFIGLPTPANTLLIVALPLILIQYPDLSGYLLNPFFIIGLTALQSFLLIAELPLFAIKFKETGLRKNAFQYLLIVSAIILIPLIQWLAVPILIFFYVFLSFIQNSLSIIRKKSN